MRWPRPDWAWLTLRGRLTLWNTTVVLLMTVATLLAARFAARATLYDDADAELRAGAREIMLAIDDFYPDTKSVVAQLKRMAKSHEERGWFVQFLTEDGQTLWKSDHCPDEVVNYPPSNLAREENIVQVGPYRYVRLRSLDPRHPVYHIRVGTYTTGLDDRLTALIRQLTIVGAALLLLTPAIGWWLARRATQPVADILGIADRLQPTRLADRLPVRGTRDELDRLSATINRLLDQVAGRIDRQDRFVADAAHELRGPLAAIQSSLQVTLAKDRNDADYRSTIQEVLDQSQHLTKLLNDLLLLAEEENTPTASRPVCDLTSVVRATSDMFAGVADERGISLRVDAPQTLRVCGDPRHLQQVCSNLLDNAIRFTPQGGRVGLTLTADEKAHQAVLTVDDTGCGISASDLPRVFDRFFQADTSRDRRNATRGGGLGLAISKAIVERYGGRIEAVSDVGRGSRFTVVLPMA